VQISIKEGSQSPAWWFRAVISAFVGLRQEDHEFQASMGYIVRTCLKRKRKEGKVVKKAF
jgi:hypothetical protein